MIAHCGDGEGLGWVLAQGSVVSAAATKRGLSTLLVEYREHVSGGCAQAPLWTNLTPKPEAVGLLGLCLGLALQAAAPGPAPATLWAKLQSSCLWDCVVPGQHPGGLERAVWAWGLGLWPRAASHSRL